MAGSALPHAVTAVAGTINSTFTYDANGNVTGGLGRGYSWFSFNKPLQVSQGTGYENFLYDTEHARMWRAAPEGGTLYFDAFGMHVEWLNNGTWYDYISANGGFVAMKVSGTTTATRYFHTDNLGSISVITNETGAVVERDGYDAWGKRRFPNGADGNPTTNQTTRGFTGQEELADVGLVHLNGRIYDPLLARMTSADPMVPDPMNGQAWNRYSYVVNNPLAFTDPSGYCFLGLCGVGNFFTNIGKDLQHFLRRVPIVGTIVEVAAAAVCLGVVVCAVTAAFISTTAVSGLETGSFKLGLRAGFIAAATAVAFWEVGNLTNQIAGVDPTKAHIQPQFGTAEYAFNVTAHAAVGCASAVASGGKCGPSALAGGVTSAAGPVINGHGILFGLVANTALGGGAAVLGGGKFENGAITSAFGYLFNELGNYAQRGYEPTTYSDGTTCNAGWGPSCFNFQLSADGQTIYNTFNQTNANNVTGFLATFQIGITPYFGFGITFTSDQGVFLGLGPGISSTPLSFAFGMTKGGPPSDFANEGSIMGGFGIIVGGTTPAVTTQFAGIGSPQLGLSYGVPASVFFGSFRPDTSIFAKGGPYP